MFGKGGQRDGNPIITGYEKSAGERLDAYPAAEGSLSRPLAREDEIVAALKDRIAKLREERK